MIHELLVLSALAGAIGAVIGYLYGTRANPALERRRWKDVWAVAGQVEVLLQRWNDLHDRVVVLEDPVKRAAQDLGLQEDHVEE